MIIFASSTLILTAKIDILDIFLNSMTMKVVIPSAVESECCGDSKTFDALTIRKVLEDGRIAVKSVNNESIVTKLQSDFNMGRGESESIAFAFEHKAKLVAIDDRKGIQACKLSGIAFTTAIGILLRSSRMGLLNRIQAQEKLVALAKFARYKPAILEDAKSQLERLK
jgi:predicted nucleic acid-binding protein